MKLSFFTDTEYGNATALVITFSVRNDLNDTFKKKAEAWEAQYVEVIKNYEANTTNSNISISFTSEVGKKELTHFCQFT